MGMVTKAWWLCGPVAWWPGGLSAFRPGGPVAQWHGGLVAWQPGGEGCKVNAIIGVTWCWRREGGRRGMAGWGGREEHGGVEGRRRGMAEWGVVEL